MPRAVQIHLGRLAICLGLVVLIGATMASRAAAEDAHDFAFTGIAGDPLPIEKFAGKVVLIVNTASFCGFTPQYADLQEVWSRYRDRGLVVLGVPSNDFGAQEPGTEADIKEFCEVNFNVDFPLTEKAHVTGPQAHPFYRWAARELGAAAAPRWNFHKYLIAPDGRLAGWLPTRVKPTSEDAIRAIEAILPNRKTSAGS